MKSSRDRLSRSAWTVAAALIVALRGAEAQGVAAPQPVASPPVAFKFPHVERRTLANGLRLLIVENHAIPLVSGRIVLDADSLLQEPTGKEGILQFDLAMLPEGTTTSNGDQIAARMAAVGNGIVIGQQLNAQNDLSFTVATEDLEPALLLLGDLVSHPAFPADAVEPVRGTQLSTLRTLKTRAPGIYVPLRIFHSMVRGGAPLRGATEATLAAITRQDLVDFHSQYVRPQLATLVLVGDVTAKSASTLAEKAFGAWTRGALQQIPISPAARPASTTMYLVDRPQGQQTAIVVGTLGPERTSSDLASIDVLNAIFDQSTDSRLGADIRQRHGYAYTVREANLSPRAPLPMVLAAFSSVAPAKTDSALVTWMSEIKGMASRPPSDSEMAFARGLLLDRLPLTFETPNQTSFQVANTLARSAASFDDSYAEKIRAVTPLEVAATAAKYLDPAHLTIVVYGDRKVIEAPLRAANIAPIVVVDENGKPVP